MKYSRNIVILKNLIIQNEVKESLINKQMITSN